MVGKKMAGSSTIFGCQIGHHFMELWPGLHTKTPTNSKIADRHVITRGCFDNLTVEKARYSTLAYGLFMPRVEFDRRRGKWEIMINRRGAGRSSVGKFHCSAR